MSDFEAFYREHVRLVYAVAYSRAHEASQAEDVTQETFLRAWRSFGQLAGFPPPAQRAWLMRTTRNLATDVWRRQSLEADALAREAQAAGANADGAELRMDLARALADLDPEDRELVTMRYLEEMNSREIGEVLGLPEGTVRRRLAECREALAQRLAQWAPQGGPG
jgi:RNA polymerase sigma-70 factor (ECF subfamily)